MKQLETYYTELQEHKKSKMKIEVKNDQDCHKKLELVSQIQNIKELSKNIEAKIGEAKERLLDS
jgi:hypothetical protein